MTAIDNIINQIEGETQNRGNTKTRIAAVLRLLRDKIERLFSTKLDKGSYTGTADDLRTSIDRKVDKVPGKVLSSNDFTNELRTKLEGLRNVDISGLLPKGGYTGTAQSLKDLIDNIMRILQSPDTELDELREIVAYIKQNKRILDTLGISNIAGLQDALNGKAPTGHNHDDRYSRLGHTHSEYAYRTHRHNWDDIDGKPALATEAKIQEAIGKIQVGGRNLLRNSRRLITNDYYGIANYVLTEELKVGDLFTITLKGRLGEGKRAFALYDQFGIREQCALFDKGGGIYQNTFNYNGYGNSSDKMILTIFVYDNSVIVNSTIEWVKLERGNTPTDWSPAPEDILEQRTIYVDSTTFNVTADVVGKTVHINRDCTINYNEMPLLSNICFRKVYDGGQITFNGGGTLRYTGDTVFNGNNGSTAVLDMSVDINRIYIDIRNV